MALTCSVLLERGEEAIHVLLLALLLFFFLGSCRLRVFLSMYDRSRRYVPEEAKAKKGNTPCAGTQTEVCYTEFTAYTLVAAKRFFRK